MELLDLNKNNDEWNPVVRDLNKPLSNKYEPKENNFEELQNINTNIDNKHEETD